jgi:hypothetical protein
LPFLILDGLLAGCHFLKHKPELYGSILNQLRHSVRVTDTSKVKVLEELWSKVNALMVFCLLTPILKIMSVFIALEKVVALLCDDALPLKAAITNIEDALQDILAVVDWAKEGDS